MEQFIVGEAFTLYVWTLGLSIKFEPQTSEFNRLCIPRFVYTKHHLAHWDVPVCELR